MRALSFTRRQFLKISAGCAAAAGVALGVDGAIIEPLYPQLKRVELQLQNLPQEFDGFTIAQLSDFHYDRYFSATPIATAVRMVNELNPELAVLTGDFVTVPMLASERQRTPKAARPANACAHLLGGLRARLQSVAVLGNHDEFSDPDEVTAALQSNGIHVLRNEAIAVERGGARFWLAGLEDLLGGRADLRKTLGGIPSRAVTVLLCHEPDFADEAAKHPIDVQLSGHSHGGQIRLPIIGAPYLPPLGKKYPWGLRRVGRMMLYTNCGIGTIRLPVRLNCPPEITLFTLRTRMAAETSSNENG